MDNCRRLEWEKLSIERKLRPPSKFTQSLINPLFTLNHSKASKLVSAENSLTNFLVNSEEQAQASPKSLCLTPSTKPTTPPPTLGTTHPQTPPSPSNSTKPQPAQMMQRLVPSWHNLAQQECSIFTQGSGLLYWLSLK